MTQVLLSLLSNAIKFTPPGGRTMIDFSVDRSSPGRASIHVSDTGIGIPGHKQEVIFEPFVQVQTGPMRAAEGAGPGPAIGRHLAQAA